MFWQLPHHAPDAPLWKEGGRVTLAGEALAALAPMEAALYALPRKSLGIIAAQNTAAATLMYLAALRTGHAVMLLPATLHPELWQAFIARYQPDWIFHPSETLADYTPKAAWQGWHWHHADMPYAHILHAELALLLATSGSTGSPQMVRLSYDNLASNAAAIAGYLGLTASDCAITSLPMAYSYGLSVLNSHLAAGASLVLTEASLMQPAFWQAMEQGVTHLAGVPSQYHMLQRLGLEKRAPESLRILTQAGGRLEAEKVTHFATLANARNWRFFVMYGQTEATARMAYLPPELALDAPDCIGVPIPGGNMQVDAGTGELIYSGPNVMMGYAEQPADLALGDVCKGVLRTGDTGERNAQGLWRITGRLKRFTKLSGVRVNLAEVERFLCGELAVECHCTGGDNALTLWLVTQESPALAEQATEKLFDRFALHPSQMAVRFLETLPLTANGKPDYRRLQAEAGR